MISEEPCELRKDRLLDMPVNVAKYFKGVSYGRCVVSTRLEFW